MGLDPACTEPPGGWMAARIIWDQPILDRTAGGPEAWKALPEKEQFAIADRERINLENHERVRYFTGYR